MLRGILAVIIITTLSLTSQNIIADPAGGFAEGKNYSNNNAIKLGNPSDAAGLIDQNADASKYQSLRDGGLINKGKRELNSEAGLFLQNSENIKEESIRREQINANNPYLKNSLAIEENPMAKGGGSSLTRSVKEEKIKIEKQCTEGVEFDIDLNLELVLDCEDEEYEEWTDYTRQETKIDGATIYHEARHLCYSVFWKKSRDGLIAHHNVPGWRAYLANKYNIEDEAMGPSVEFPPRVRMRDHKWFHIDGRQTVYRYYPFIYYTREKLKKRRFKKNGEYWQVNNRAAELLTERNECYEVSRKCIKSGPKTFFDKYEVSRDCWQEVVTYHCQTEPKNGCRHLFDQSCYIKSSRCEEQVGSICLRWKRVMECGGVKKTERFSMADTPIYCLGGNCHEAVLEENQDFSNVAYLAAVNEAKNDCVKDSRGLCKTPITIFPGNQSGCKKMIFSAIDCCSSMKGWAKSANLCRCTGEEKALAMRRERGLCHYVGTDCTKRDPVAKKCIQKTSRYCCFSSKLARIFQEQARLQLGRGWGSASSPNCQPITLADFIKIDFSKIDLEELFGDLLNKGKSMMSKSFPAVTPGKVPDIQQQRTDPAKKRDM